MTLRARLVAKNIAESVESSSVADVIAALEGLNPGQANRLERAISRGQPLQVGNAILHALRSASIGQAEADADAELADGTLPVDLVQELIGG